LLFRVSFKTKEGSLQEIRSWLTRRLTCNLWPGIVQSMERHVALTQPAAVHASAEIVGMGHQASVSEIRDAGGFDTPFQPAADSADSLPFGGTPILITAFHCTVDIDPPLRINFVSNSTKGFEVAFTPAMLHGFCQVLQHGVKTAGWDIELRLPGTDRNTGPRILN
jgi:hypothetical protein